MKQICEGVEYIHKQNIIHLDLKASIFQLLLILRWDWLNRVYIVH